MWRSRGRVASSELRGARVRGHITQGIHVDSDASDDTVL